MAGVWIMSTFSVTVVTGQVLTVWTDRCLGATVPPPTAWDRLCSPARQVKENTWSNTAWVRRRASMWTSRTSSKKSFFMRYMFGFVLHTWTLHCAITLLSVSSGFSQEHGTWTASLQTAPSSRGSAVTQNLLICMLWGQWELIIQNFSKHEKEMSFFSYFNNI